VSVINDFSFTSLHIILSHILLVIVYISYILVYYIRIILVYYSYITDILGLLVYTPILLIYFSYITCIYYSYIILNHFAGLTSQISECYHKAVYPLEERQPCNKCPKYTSKLIGVWSDCILDSDVTEDSIGRMILSTASYCGIGRRYHALVCQDESENNVSARACSQSGSPC
jgi:hypothetical protein